MGIGLERCNDVRGFERPMCGHKWYYRILVTRDNQQAYRTSLYGCGGCSVMFSDRAQCTHNKTRYGWASYRPG